MAIRFEDDKGGDKPAKKPVGGKTFVAEEPSASPEAAKPAAKKKGGKAKP